MVRREILLLLDGPVAIGKRGVRTVADQAVNDWPAVKAQIEPHLKELLDLEADRNPKVYDYFVFVDRVEQENRRWHSFNWHVWSSPGNEGRYELNTTNAGRNDFATVNCRLELLAEDDTPLGSHNLSFGRAWDRAFRAAFARPKFFDSYGQAFQGILEPGVMVPFGAGWLEVPAGWRCRSIWIPRCGRFAWQSTSIGPWVAA